MGNVNEVVGAEEKTSTKATKKTTAKAETKTTKKAPAKKATTSKKASTVKTDIYVQYEGKQIDQSLVVKKVEADCKKQKIEVKEIVLYLKPEDNACYYVVNGELAGKVDLF